MNTTIQQWLISVVEECTVRFYRSTGLPVTARPSVVVLPRNDHNTQVLSIVQTEMGKVGCYRGIYNPTAQWDDGTRLDILLLLVVGPEQAVNAGIKTINDAAIDAIGNPATAGVDLLAGGVR